MSEKQILNGSQELTFRITGNEMSMEKGYKLDSVLSTLQDADNLIKSTYLSLNERKRFTDNDADKIEIRLKDVREGSFIGEVVVAYKNIVLPLVPILASDPEFILTTIKNSYEFLKAKIVAKKEGKEVSVTQTATAKDVSVAVNGNNNTVNIVAPVGFPKVAESLQQSISKLTENIDERNVDGISLGKKSDPIDSENNLIFSSSDKELFAGRTLVSEDEFRITGKVVSGNYETSKGKIEIINTDSEDLVVGSVYNIDIDDKLHAEEVWRDIFLTEKDYFCKSRLKKSSDGDYKVKEILITDWFEENK